MIGSGIGFALASGGYLVESNQGRTVMFPGDDSTIVGYRASAATTIVDANGSDRAFDVDPATAGITVSLVNLTIRNGANPLDFNFFAAGIYNQGNLTVTDSIITGNTAPEDGGGIFSSGGPLTVIEVCPAELGLVLGRPAIADLRRTIEAGAA